MGCSVANMRCCVAKIRCCVAKMRCCMAKMRCCVAKMWCCVAKIRKYPEEKMERGMIHRGSKGVWVVFWQYLFISQTDS